MFIVPSFYVFDSMQVGRLCKVLTTSTACVYIFEYLAVLGFMSFHWNLISCTSKKPKCRRNHQKKSEHKRHFDIKLHKVSHWLRKLLESFEKSFFSRFKQHQLVIMRTANSFAGLLRLVLLFWHRRSCVFLFYSLRPHLTLLVGIKVEKNDAGKIIFIKILFSVC